MTNELEIIEALRKAHSYSGSEFSFESIMAKLASNDALLISVDGLHSVIVINQYETYRACCVQLAGGTLTADNLAKGQALIERFAKDNDCQEVEVYGRSGWAKLLVPLGYEQAYVVMKKKLEVL